MRCIVTEDSKIDSSSVGARISKVKDSQGYHGESNVDVRDEETIKKEVINQLFQEMMAIEEHKWCVEHRSKIMVTTRRQIQPFKMPFQIIR